MPNGEVICHGKTLGWFKDMKKHLRFWATPQPKGADMTERELPPLPECRTDGYAIGPLWTGVQMIEYARSAVEAALAAQAAELVATVSGHVADESSFFGKYDKGVNRLPDGTKLYAAPQPKEQI